ncbi:hypothetical protein [Frankia sp. Cas3]|uniref:hypothetical protein n=1 Tax=Frankia sp. Cas3 TaxID=3073926 RepID=UPI002AD27F50|nr:hypothetical protein [Frankia sp. Cas3]
MSVTALCPDCQVPIGTAHDDDCDRAICLLTGGQRLICADGEHDDEPDGDCGRDVWTGHAGPDRTPPGAAGEQELTVAGEEATTVPGADLLKAPRIDPVPAGETALVDQTPTETRSRVARRVWEVAIGQWPSVWSAPPTELAALVRYAAAGQWCAPDATTWRRLGQAYCVLLAIPVSVALYVAAWLVQRPGRLVAAAVLATIVWLVL